jgi:hypothetical protein
MWSSRRKVITVAGIVGMTALLSIDVHLRPHGDLHNFFAGRQTV